MRKGLIALTIGLLCLSQPVLAQETSLSPEPPTAPAYVVPQALSEALSATPPERSKFGRAFANDAESLRQIDLWIEHTAIDAPSNLIMRDILLAMPISIAGPRLVDLAKKSHDPVIQETWERHLKAYPGPYSHVLVSWILASSGDSQRTYELLSTLGEIQPATALTLWSLLIANNPLSRLDKVGEYGYLRAGALEALSKHLSDEKTTDEISRLRLYRAVIHTLEENPNAGNLPSLEIADRDIATFLEHKAVSRRIVALDLIATLKRDNYLSQARDRYQEAKNTTERAHAMRALFVNDTPLEERVSMISKALSEGDEIMRIEASRLLISAPDVLSGIDTAILRTAFEKELWPETQLSLYRALSAHLPDANFRHDILLNAQLMPSTRLAALRDLSETSESAKALSLNDLATLQRQEAPLDLIAETAEALYDWNPETRQTLQKWIVVQRPFERRILLTFSRFVRRDSIEATDVIPEYIREVCRHGAEDENTLMPCISYFEDHAMTEDDKNILNTLQTRKKQFDMMLDL